MECVWLLPFVLVPRWDFFGNNNRVKSQSCNREAIFFFFWGGADEMSGLSLPPSTKTKENDSWYHWMSIGMPTRMLFFLGESLCPRFVLLRLGRVGSQPSVYRLMFPRFNVCMMYIFTYINPLNYHMFVNRPCIECLGLQQTLWKRLEDSHGCDTVDGRKWKKSG